MEEIVVDGAEWIPVEPYRPDMLAARIREVLADPSRWQSVGEEAVATARRYTWRALAPRSSLRMPSGFNRGGRTLVGEPIERTLQAIL